MKFNLLFPVWESFICHNVINRKGQVLTFVAHPSLIIAWQIKYRCNPRIDIRSENFGEERYSSLCCGRYCGEDLNIRMERYLLGKYLTYLTIFTNRFGCIRFYNIFCRTLYVYADRRHCSASGYNQDVNSPRLWWIYTTFDVRLIADQSAMGYAEGDYFPTYWALTARSSTDPIHLTCEWQFNFPPGVWQHSQWQEIGMNW